MDTALVGLLPYPRLVGRGWKKRYRKMVIFLTGKPSHVQKNEGQVLKYHFMNPIPLYRLQLVWKRPLVLQFSIEKEQKSSTPPDGEMELEQNLLCQHERMSRDQEERETLQGVFVSISLSF